MTFSEYNDLCFAHGFPRIGDDPVAAARELHLINVARQHPDDTLKYFFDAHYKEAWGVEFFKVPLSDQFPSATMANGQTKNTDTDTMNINTTVKIEISFEEKAEAVLNKFAEALFMVGTRGDAAAAQVREALTTTPATDETETPATPAPEPKKKEKKAPVLKAPEPAIEPEPDILANVPTGAELKAKVLPLKDTPFLKQLRDYMDGPLGLKGTGLAAVTDVDALKKLEIKVTELLAAKEAADDV